MDGIKYNGSRFACDKKSFHICINTLLIITYHIITVSAHVILFPISAIFFASGSLVHANAPRDCRIIAALYIVLPGYQPDTQCLFTKNKNYWS